MAGAAGSPSAQAAIQRLRQFLMKQQTVPAQVMQQHAEELKTEIKAETPYKTGKLENSVYVHVVRAGASRTTLTAGANAISRGENYAWIQHENTSFQHPIKGKAHYVSDPVDALTDRLISEMRDGIKYGG